MMAFYHRAHSNGLPLASTSSISVTTILSWLLLLLLSTLPTAMTQPFTADPSCLEGGNNSRKLSIVSSGSGQSGDVTSSITDEADTSLLSSNVIDHDVRDGIPLLRGSSDVKSSKQRQLMKEMNGVDSEQNVVFRFNLRMFWSEGYCWQEEAIERRWCLACPGKICNENDVLWIMDCDSNDIKQQFIFTEESSPTSGRISPYSRPDLCWHRVAGAGPEVEFKLRSCDPSSIHQLFDGFDISSVEFELHPREFTEDCMTQAHHPKREELIFREPCKIAQKDKTSLWVVDNGSFVSIDTDDKNSTPRDQEETCTYEPLLDNNQRLTMNERVQVSTPVEAYIVMQNDGNLVVWSGTRENRGKLIWKSNVSISPKLGYQFKTVLQGDGHLLTSYNDESGKRKFVFRSLSVSGVGNYFLAVNCDGKSLSIFRRHVDSGSSQTNVEAVWTTEPR